MPDPKLQAYLASHYLSGPKADAILARTADPSALPKKKKKKRKLDGAPGDADGGGLVFRDDSDAWKADQQDDDESQEQDGYAVVSLPDSARQGAFKRAAWSSVRKGEGSASDAAVAGPSSQPAAAAQLENPPAQAQPRPSPEPPTMKAGLKTKEQIRAERLAREARQRQEAEEQARQDALDDSRSRRATAHGEGAAQSDRPDQQTVYRDSSGRRIDIRAEEAEQRRLALEAERKQRERDQWGKGLVQRQAQAEQAERLRRIKHAKFEQRADDQDVVDHFRRVEHWDDPALAFMAKKRSDAPQMPMYKGPPPPPNRFGILPGYRWDGVDRSNGFERALFQRKNALGRRQAEARAWGQEDM